MGAMSPPRLLANHKRLRNSFTVRPGETTSRLMVRIPGRGQDQRDMVVMEGPRIRQMLP